MKTKISSLTLTFDHETCKSLGSLTVPGLVNIKQKKIFSRQHCWFIDRPSDQQYAFSFKGGGDKNSIYVFHQGSVTSKEIKSSLPFVDLCLKSHDCSGGFALIYKIYLLKTSVCWFQDCHCHFISQKVDKLSWHCGIFKHVCYAVHLSQH